MGWGENKGEKVLSPVSRFCILFYRVCVCVCAGSGIAHAGRAGFSHHLVGCVAAGTSWDVHGVMLRKEVTFVTSLCIRLWDQIGLWGLGKAAAEGDNYFSGR